jgi:hypothetical protein
LRSRAAAIENVHLLYECTVKLDWKNFQIERNHMTAACVDKAIEDSSTENGPNVRDEDQRGRADGSVSIAGLGAGLRA